MKPLAIIFPFISIGVSSCGTHDGIYQELTSSGVVLCIDRDTSDYTGIIDDLRREDFQKILKEYSNSARDLSVGVTASPLTCNQSSVYARATIIELAPKSPDQVGASLRIYFSEENEIKLAELYVTKLMP